MTTVRRDGQETRRRLLDAAAKIFAAKGFHQTKVAEICRTAQANTAAVNYHFGSKENLYQESWRTAFENGVKTYPPDGGVPPGAPLEERLRGRILATMRRAMAPDSLDFDIGRREMASPTGLLAEVMRRAIEPLHRDLVVIVSGFLGQGASEHQIALAAMSIISQCHDPLLHERECRDLPVNERPPGPTITEIGLETAADHVLRFSLAGLEAMRKQLENNTEPMEDKG